MKRKYKALWWTQTGIQYSNSLLSTAAIFAAIDMFLSMKSPEHVSTCLWHGNLEYILWFLHNSYQNSRNPINVFTQLLFANICASFQVACSSTVLAQTKCRGNTVTQLHGMFSPAWSSMLPYLHWYLYLRDLIYSWFSPHNLKSFSQLLYRQYPQRYFLI